MKFHIAIALPIVVFAAVSGCSNVDTAVSDDSQTESVVANNVEANSNDAKVNLVGKWNMHVEQTISANKALLNGGQINAAAFRETLRSMVMDFELYEDNTFDCYEEAGGEISDYTGKWELDGDKVQLRQEFRNGEKKADLLSGTVKENRMDLVHKQQGLSLKLVLLR